MQRRIFRSRIPRLAAVCGSAVLVSGCYSHHVDHRDTIGSSAGDAQAINRIVQMRDPWPAGAWDKSIDHDGTRMVNAIDAYHRPKPVGDPNQQALNELANGPSTAQE